MKRFFAVLLCAAVAVTVFFCPRGAGAAGQAGANLIFIHHSCGENWLRDGLSGELNRLGFHVADITYGWREYGDRTDTSDWPLWFTDEVMGQVYAELGTMNAENDLRPAGGENTVVLFKSCFPNSDVGDGIHDEKEIYLSLLGYIESRPDKLFILATPPPMQSISNPRRTRELCGWLADREAGWLSGLGTGNAFVFDLYNVLTHPDAHHRIEAGREVHAVVRGADTLWYDSSGDDHPNRQGNEKAAGEFAGLLKHWYGQFAARLAGEAETPALPWETGGAAPPPESELEATASDLPTAEPAEPEPTAAKEASAAPLLSGRSAPELVLVPDPLSADNPIYPEGAAALPSAGESLSDPGLGTAYTRVTGDSAMRHERSRFDPFNADKSLVLLYDCHEGCFRVCRASVPYDAQENRVCRLDMEEPRWDPVDPDLLTGLSGFRIVRFSVSSGETATLKDFALDPRVGPVIAADSGLYCVTARGEGESSLDGRWWALALQGSAGDCAIRCLFTWDRDTDTVPGLLTLDAGTCGIDWVGMSPKGTWVVIAGAYNNAPPLRGMVIADLALSSFHQIDRDSSRSDTGLDSAGREVLVMYDSGTGFIDLVPLDPSTRPVPEGDESRYEGTGRVPLLRLEYSGDSPFALSSEVHISCSAQGWALVSASAAPGAPQRSWLDGSIALLRLDPSAPETYLVAKTHNVTGDYWEETQGTLTRDGKTALWAANFGKDPGMLRLFLMRLDLP